MLQFILFLLLTLFLPTTSQGKSTTYSSPKKIKSTSATYKLVKIYFKQTWTTMGYDQIGSGKRYPEVLDPLPLYTLHSRCRGRVLVIIPFEQLIYQAKDKEIATGKTRITERGSRLLIYEIDFENRDIDILFNGVLVDFHGEIKNSARVCPDLLVKVKRDGKIKLTKLFFKEGKYNHSEDITSKSLKSK